MNSSLPELHSGQTVALVLFANIGDLLLLEPVIRFLNHQGVTLDLFCTTETAMVWRDDPRIRRIIPIPSRNTRYVRGESPPMPLPRDRYDHLIDFWPTGRSVKLALRLRARFRRTWRKDGVKRLFYPMIYSHLVFSEGLDIRRDRVYMTMLGLSGLEADAWLPAQLSIHPDELHLFRQKYPQFSTAQSENLIVIQPTARWNRKLWKKDCWREVILHLQQKQGAKCILISGPSAQEKEMVMEIAGGLVPDNSVFAGTLPWRELACAFASAKLFVGLDSAPYHLASMLGRPLVVLFGTSNSREWGPVLPQQIALQAPEINGTRSLENLPASRVIEVLDSMLFKPGL